METPFFCRCKEEFPVNDAARGWSMGEMRPLKKAPKRIWIQYRDWLDEELHAAYLCGNCYFDLEDEF